MESQKRARSWKRYSVKRFLAYFLALVMLCGAMPLDMLAITAQATEVSGGNLDLQDVTEGGETNQNDGISAVSEDPVTVTVTAKDKEIVWDGTSPIQINITDIFTIENIAFEQLSENEDFKVTLDATNMPSVDSYPNYKHNYKRLYLKPTKAGSMTVELEIFTNEAKNIVGAKDVATITLTKGELSEEVKGEYFLDFGGFTEAEYGNDLDQDDIKVIDNTGEECTGNVTYKYYKDGEEINEFPKDIGTYTVEATIDADLWNSFKISKTLKIIPKKIYVDVTTEDYQYGLVDAEGKAETIEYVIDEAYLEDLEAGDSINLTCSTTANANSEPEDYWIYVVGDNENYEVVVNRDSESGKGYVTIVKREITASWDAEEKYALKHTAAEQSVNALLSNVLERDKADVSLTYEGNTATLPGDYNVKVTGITGDKAHCYTLTNPDITKDWTIDYADDANKGEASVSGTTVAPLEGELQWFSGDVKLVAPENYQITFTPYEDWADEIALTDLEAGANTYTYYLMQKDSKLIVGKESVTVNYDNAAPSGKLTFKGVEFLEKVADYTQKFFINDAVTVSYDADALNETVSGGDLYRIDYAVAAPGVDLEEAEADHNKEYGDFWKNVYDKVKANGAESGTFTVVPSTSVTEATLAGQADCGLGEQVIYLKITDMAGKETVISTDTIVVFDGMKVDNMEGKDYAAEYQLAAGKEVTVTLKPKSVNPFDDASKDDYIEYVIIGKTGGNQINTLTEGEGKDYTYDAEGNLILYKSAFDKVTEVGIDDTYTVYVMLKPFGNQWCEYYGGNDASAENANNALTEITFEIKAVKSDASIEFESLTESVVYDGAAFDDFEVALGQEGGTRKDYYAVYDSKNVDEAGNPDYTKYVWTEGLPTNVGNYVIKAAIEFEASDLYNNAAAYGSFAITKAKATATMTVDGRAYTGNADAAVKAVTVVPENNALADRLVIDEATIVAAFDDANVGVNKTVSFVKFADDAKEPGVKDGSDLFSNYEVTFETTTATITPAQVSITVDETVQATYGSEIALDIKEEDVTVTGIVAGEDYDTVGITYGLEEAAKYNVGNYAVTAECSNTNYEIESITGTVKVNPLPIQVTWNYTENTEYFFKDADYTVEATIDNLVDGDVAQLVFETSFLKDGQEIGGTIGNSFSDIGTYRTFISAVDNEDGNYTIEGSENLSVDWEIKEFNPDVDITLSTPDGNSLGGEASDYGWYTFDTLTQLDVTAPTGYEFVLENVTDGYVTGKTFAESDLNTNDYNDYTYKLREITTGYITNARDLRIAVDTVAPTGTLVIEDKEYKNLLDAIISLFYKTDVVFSVNWEDDNFSGIEMVYYATLDEALAEGETIAENDWKEYGTEEDVEKSIHANTAVFVYVKIVDAAGNATVINSDGIVVYTDSETTETTAKEYTKYSGLDIVSNITFNDNTVKDVVILNAADGTVAKDGFDYTVDTEKGTVTIEGTVLDTLSTANVDAEGYAQYKICVTMNPMGYTYVEAAGNEAPTAVTIGLKVAKAAASITAEPFTKTYDGEAVEVDAASGIQYTTTNKDADPVVTATYYECVEGADGAYEIGEEMAEAPKNAGTYYVKLTIAESENYTAATSKEALVTINKKAAAATITIKKKEYDGEKTAAVDKVTFTEGLVNNETFTFDAEKNGAGFVFADKNVGEWAVSLDGESTYDDLAYTGADINNYEVTYTVDKAEITKKDLYVEIAPMSSVYGSDISVSMAGSAEDNSLLNVTHVSGLVGDEELSKVLSVSYEYTFTRENRFTAGEHNVPFTAEEGFTVTCENYNVLLKDAEGNDTTAVALAVSKRPISVKWVVSNVGLVDDEEIGANYRPIDADSSTVIYNAKAYSVSPKSNDINGYDNLVEGDRIDVVRLLDSTDPADPNEYLEGQVTVPGEYISSVGPLEYIASDSNDNANYVYAEGGDSIIWKIEYLDTVDEKYQNISVTGTEGADDWYRSDVTITPSYEAGCSISTNGKNDADAAWAENVVVSAEGIATGKYAVKNSKGYITSLIDYTAKVDKTAPEAEITVEYSEEKKESFLNKILTTLSFGIFSLNDVTITVSSGDAVPADLTKATVSGVASTTYQLLDDDDAVVETLKNSENWTENTWKAYDAQKGIAISSNSKKIVLVKVEDNAGNYEIYNADGVVVYTNATTNSLVEVTPGEGESFAAFKGYKVERVDADDISLEINLNGNTFVGVSCDDAPLVVDKDYVVEIADDVAKLTLKKAFVASLRADDSVTEDIDEGMHNIAVSFHALGEEFVAGTSLGDAPDDIEFSIKMVKKQGKVELDETYAAVYDGGFVDTPEIASTLSSGSPVFQFKKKGAADYSSSRPKDAGEYTVKVTIPEDDYYTVAYDELDFTIAKKELEIIVPVETKVYDGTTAATVDELIGLTVVTGVDGEAITATVSDVDGFCTFADENVGKEKEITVADASKVTLKAANEATNLDNYTDNLASVYKADKADITARPVTLTVNAASKTYGEANPKFTYTAEKATATNNRGLVGEDTPGTVILMTDADEYSPVDTYDVVLDGENWIPNLNYDVEVKGEDAFTITKRPITSVVWDTNLTLTYNAKAQSVAAAFVDGDIVGNDDVKLVYAKGTNVGTDAGSYKAEITGIEGNDAANYDASGLLKDKSATAAWSIEYLTVSGNATVKDASGNDVEDWYNGDVTIYPPKGYYIAEDNKNADAGWLESISYKDEAASNKGNDYTYFLKSIENGGITGEMSTNIKLDKSAPGGTIEISDNVINVILNKLTFGKFFNKTVEITIDAEDTLSGVAKVEYILADSFEAYEAAKAAGEWTTLEAGKNSFKIEPSKKAAVFARITDNAENVLEINSDGMVVYQDVTKVTESAEFVKATDANVDIQVSLNNNTVDAITIGRTTLVKGTDYTVVETAGSEGYGKITLNNSYLKTLAASDTAYDVVISYRPMDTKYVDGVSEGDAPLTTTVKLTVSKNTANTISKVEDMSKTYDGKAVEPVVTTIEGYEGNVVTYYKDAKADDTAYTAVAPKAAGTYVAKFVAGEDDNYAANDTNKQTFTIAQREVTVNVIAQEIVYGDAVPTFTAEVDKNTAMAEGEDYNDLKVTLAAQIDAEDVKEDVVNAGKYNVEGASANANYKVVVANGADALVVNPRPVAFVWDRNELTYNAMQKTVLPECSNLVLANEELELEITGNTGTAVGKYTAEVTAISGNNNYTLTDATGTTFDWSIVYAVADSEAVLNGGSAVNGWYTQDVEVAAPEGYKISTQNTSAAEENWTDKLNVSKEAESTVTYYLQDQTFGFITDAMTVAVKIDKTAPTGSITVKNNVFKEVVNTITFGAFFKETVDVKIAAEDAVSGIAKIEYQRVDSAELFNAESGWKSGDEFTISKNSTSVIYARLTDNAGHVTVINSDGVVVYTDSEQDTESITFTKTSKDNVTAKVDLNDNTVKGIKNGEYELTAADYSVEGKVITFNASYLDTLAAGEYTLEVSYNPYGKEYVAADGNEAPVTTTIKLVVVKKSLAADEMITISDMSKTYDGKAVAPTVTALSTGAKTITYAAKGSNSFAAEAPKAAGTYVIKVAVAEDANYAAAEATAEFTIARMAITVTADDQTVVAGSEVKADAFKVTTGALAEGETVASIKLAADTAKVTTDAKITASEAVIKDAAGADVTANYEVSYAAGKLVVEHNTSLVAEKMTVELVKTGYEQGEAIKTEDIKVVAEYADGYKANITDFTTNIAELDMNEVGVKVLKVSYTENGATITKEFQIDVTPDQTKVGFEVIQGSDAPVITVVSNAEQLKNDVLTAEEIASGESFNIYLEIKDISDEVSNGDKQLVKSVLGKRQVGAYFDIALYKKLGEKALTSVHDLSNKVKICMNIPKELLVNPKKVERTYVVIRIHNGEAEIIEGVFDEEKATFTFETDKFSTYVLAYRDKDIEDDDDDTSTSGSGSASGSGSTGSSFESTTTGTKADTSATVTGPVSPKTGDSGFYTEFMMLIVALGVMIITAKVYGKKEQED